MADVCKNCKFYFPDGWTTKGKCRRYPPQVIVRDASGFLSDGSSESQFPIVNPADWCGEFKQKG